VLVILSLVRSRWLPGCRIFWRTNSAVERRAKLRATPIYWAWRQMWSVMLNKIWKSPLDKLARFTGLDTATQKSPRNSRGPSGLSVISTRKVWWLFRNVGKCIGPYAIRLWLDLQWSCLCRNSRSHTKTTTRGATPRLASWGPVQKLEDLWRTRLLSGSERHWSFISHARSY
jgi:hypothetical protein